MFRFTLRMLLCCERGQKITEILLHLSFLLLQTRNTDTPAQLKFASISISCGLARKSFMIFNDTKTLSLLCCSNSGSFQRFGIEGQPPLFLPPHLASLSSQFTPPLFGVKGECSRLDEYQSISARAQSQMSF
jgi:hypothetical protein